MIGRLTSIELRELRRRLGLTQEQFAARIGVTMGTVAHWESGVHRISALAQRAIEALIPPLSDAPQDAQQPAGSPRGAESALGDQEGSSPISDRLDVFGGYVNKMTQN